MNDLADYLSRGFGFSQIPQKYFFQVIFLDARYA